MVLLLAGDKNFTIEYMGLAHEQTESIYSRRIACCYRNHSASYGRVAARPQQGTRTGQTRRLPQQPQAVDPCMDELRIGEQRKTRKWRS
jgi:hypothetical protein